MAAAGVVAISAACGRSSSATAAPPTVSHQQGPWRLTGVSNVRQIAKLTGPGAINDTSKVLLAGTDLGSMFADGDRTWFVFGDTFGKRADDAVGGTGEIWKSNCLAWSTDRSPENGITFDGWVLDDLDQVKEVLPGLKNPNDGSGEVTKIPTQGFAVGDSLFLHFMSVKQWGEPGKWDCNYAALAHSSDRGQTWQTLDWTWPGDSGFCQLAHATVVEDRTTYVYLWGIPGGRFGPVRLMRVPATAEAVKDQTRYEYFSGLQGSKPHWSKRLADAQVVLNDTIGELSVLWHPPTKRWLLTTIHGTSAGTVLYEGLNPWGPWSKPHSMQTQAQEPGLYSPYLHPRYVSDDGRTVYFTLSLWGPYNVFWYAMNLDYAKNLDSKGR